MYIYKKHRSQKLMVLFLATLLVVTSAFLPFRAYAENNELFIVLDQMEHLQNLAEDFVQETNSSSSDAINSSPQFLTINYIRAQRYHAPEWDMILGLPSDEFAQYVQQKAPELAGLQTILQIDVPQANASLDFIHLIAGIGAALHGVPIAATWGGDALQLSMAGKSTDFDACYNQLKPLFGNSDENITFWPQSDLMADLDAVNIGNTMQKEDSLAEAIRTYYDDFSYEKQARQFVARHLGGADTADLSGFALQIRDLLIQDAGMQLLLLAQKQLSYDETGGLQIPQDVLVPIQVSCTLLAEHLSQAVNGQTIPAEEVSAQEDKTENASAAVVPEDTSDAESAPMYWLYQNRQLLLLGMIGCAALLIVILGYLFTHRNR